MVIGIKDVFKLLGMIIISVCAVFVCALFLNYGIDLRGVESQITDGPMRAMYDAQTMNSTMVCSVSGGCLALTSVVMLCFYIKQYIDSHRRELGILKALGYSNPRIAGGFWVFGFSVFIGASIGYAGAVCIMPTFYSVQNEDKLLPEFDADFHIDLLIFLVIVPTAVYALLSVIYSLIKMRTPVMELLKGKSDTRVKAVKITADRPFLREMKSAVVRSKKSLVFFIAFASFCYSALVQMAFAMNDLASEFIAIMMLAIGLTLAFVTLFIATATVVKSNAKSVSIMRAFGYSGRECSSAVLNGYRPAVLIGFILGTGYQYLLLKIAVEVVFKDVENVPEFNFSVRALIIAAVSFAVIYEVTMHLYSRKISRISLKEIMLDFE